MKSKRKFSPKFKANESNEAVKGQQTLSELASKYEGISKYIELYNNRRIHQRLDYRTPSKIFFTTA